MSSIKRELNEVLMERITSVKDVKYNGDIIGMVVGYQAVDATDIFYMKDYFIPVVLDEDGFCFKGTCDCVEEAKRVVAGCYFEGKVGVEDSEYKDSLEGVGSGFSSALYKGIVKRLQNNIDYIPDSVKNQ